ncbi:hypothetical protein [Niabella hibiscisoli]|uniref:hypothetical protein n=1 Tax=Niabella hibiscisoli TaxID=1825928 RepID=UPI001F10B83D|nr:hypothetical protein [Niabella hibiscisoli]MCH5720000.1 hypothetical protein [Niabella hibiscisoli]
MVKYLLLIIVLVVPRITNAQKQSVSFNKTLQKIYLTTDKVIYTPNEQLWFAAYLFENQSQIRDTSDILTIGLYDPISDRMTTLKKFPLRNRIATGNILLPDSLIAGSYNLVAYTNILNKQHVPIGTGFKPLRIYAKTGDKAFTTSLKISDSLSTPDKIAIQHEIIPESYQVTFKDARARYQFAGERSRTLELDKYGNDMVYINPKDIKTTNRSLSVTTIYEGDTVKNRIRIPENMASSSDLSASFYPEAGFLAPGYPNRVFWEVTNNNTASSSPALLLEDDRVIDTIETTANGASAFYVNAKPGKQYAVNLGLKNNHSQKFLLPSVATDGLRFEIPDVVVNDSLNIELWSKEKNHSISGGRCNWLPSVHKLDISSYKKLTVILDDFARGLCKVFITDEQNRILARSYFFAHYDKRNHLVLRTDKEVYKTRDSILLNMAISNSAGTSLNAIATVNCVLLSRVDFNMAKNLESDHDLHAIVYNEPVFVKRKNILDSSLLLEHIIRMKTMDDTDTILTNGNSLAEGFLKPGVQLKLARFGKREKSQWILCCSERPISPF